MLCLSLFIQECLLWLSLYILCVCVCVQIVFSFTDLQIKRKHIQTWCRENYVYHLETLILQAWCCLAGLSDWTLTRKEISILCGKESDQNLWKGRSVSAVCQVFFFFAFWSYGRTILPGLFKVGGAMWLVLANKL